MILIAYSVYYGRALYFKNAVASLQASPLIDSTYNHPICLHLLSSFMFDGITKVVIISINACNDINHVQVLAYMLCDVCFGGREVCKSNVSQASINIIYTEP
ncbi:hypothetical protein SAY87_029576 [Trapa incisa]|uniref:Uncharacterized protein n=1 Tax=Trapa incisa TaxID=236973 RepID=A0AAN7KD45_9MYRT|nr:hypothetical protein SAY87_029576 [Trapa incisa]